MWWKGHAKQTSSSVPVVLWRRSKLFCWVVTFSCTVTAVSIFYISTTTSTTTNTQWVELGFKTGVDGAKILNDDLSGTVKDVDALNRQLLIKLTTALSDSRSFVNGTVGTRLSDAIQQPTSRLNGSQCNGDNVDIVICVHSDPRNSPLRDMIRHTWANPSVWIKFRVRTLFLIGQPVKSTNASNGRTVFEIDTALQRAIAEESRNKGDVIVGDFLDTYRNLTLKTLTALKWVTHHCSDTAYYIKVDDDVIVNSFQVQKMLSTQPPPPAGYLADGEIACCYFRGLAVKRNRSISKWAVTERELSPDVKVYPPFCSGMGYIMRTRTAVNLYRASLSERFFWIDDIYVTGFLAKRINATFRHLNVAWDSVSTRRAFSAKTWQNNTFGHGIKNPAVLRRMWFRLALIVGKRDISFFNFIRAMSKT